MTEIPLTAMRRRTTELRRELQKNPGRGVHVTHRGKHCLVVMSAELYGSIVETLDLILDPKAVVALRGSFADIEYGRVRTLDEVARRRHLRR